MLLLLAGCSRAVDVTIDAQVDANADVSPELPKVDDPCLHFRDLCGVIMGLQDDARRCTFGAPNQCTEVLGRELLADSEGAHQIGQCPLFVTSAQDPASKRLSAAIDTWSKCAACGCDLKCYARGSRLPCLTQSECMPNGRCRESEDLIDAGSD